MTSMKNAQIESRIRTMPVRAALLCVGAVVLATSLCVATPSAAERSEFLRTFMTSVNTALPTSGQASVSSVKQSALSFLMLLFMLAILGAKSPTAPTYKHIKQCARTIFRPQILPAYSLPPVRGPSLL